jgi:hypothetical protein
MGQAVPCTRKQKPGWGLKFFEFAPKSLVFAVDCAGLPIIRPAAWTFFISEPCSILRLFKRCEKAEGGNMPWQG